MDVRESQIRDQNELLRTTSGYQTGHAARHVGDGLCRAYQPIFTHTTPMTPEQSRAAAVEFCEWWDAHYPKQPDESWFSYRLRAIQSLTDPVIFAEFKRIARKHNAPA
jgi:hypothetical protein